MLISKGQTILFEGDSLTSRNTPPAYDTWPFLRMMNWHRTYADVVQEWLFANRPDLELKFRNSAVGGSSAGQILSRFDAVVPVVKPNWIIFTCAANDAARKIPLEQYRQELTTYAQRAKEVSGARLLIVSGFKPCPGLPADHPLYAGTVNSYFAAAKEVMEANNGVFFEIGPKMLAKAEALYKQSTFHTLYSDGGHFNELGNQVIAGLVLEKLGVFEMK